MARYRKKHQSYALSAKVCHTNTLCRAFGRRPETRRVKKRHCRGSKGCLLNANTRGGHVVGSQHLQLCRKKGGENRKCWIVDAS